MVARRRDRSRRRRYAGQEAAQHHRRPHQQHDRKRDLADHEQAPRPEAYRAVASSALLQGVGQRRASGAERRHHPGQDAGEDRRAEREQQHARVHRDLVGPRHLVGQERRPRARLRCASSRPAAPPASASTSASIEQLLEDPPAAGAERSPDRDLLAAAERAREQQVARRCAGDQQHQPHRGQQHHQRRPDVADDRLAERDHGGAPAGVRLRVRLLQPLGDDLQLRRRLRDVHARPQPGDRLLVVVLAYGALGVGEAQGNPDLAAGREPRGRENRRA